MNRWEFGILLMMLLVSLNVHPAYGMASRAWGNEGETPFWSELFADASPIGYMTLAETFGAGLAMPIIRWGELQVEPRQKPCNSLDILFGSDTTEDIQAGPGVSTTLENLAKKLNAQVAIPQALRVGAGIIYDFGDEGDWQDKTAGLLYAGWDF